MTTRRSKDIGTDAERAVARFLVVNGWPAAERRALAGAFDKGDITGTPGIAWEVKGGDAAKRASDALMGAWRAETRIERDNAGADVGILVTQRAGYGASRAGNWWATFDLIDVARLLKAAPIPFEVSELFGVRMTLFAATCLLRSAGYGEPLALAGVGGHGDG